MDGFTFLRIIMAKQPTPVIVVSSHSKKENVFKALELGAVDFVEKTDPYTSAANEAFRAQLMEKILLTRNLTHLRPVTRSADASRGSDPMIKVASMVPAPRNAPKFIVAIASSTGGPAALLDLLPKVPQKFPGAIIIAQHMPATFTKTFAERLDRSSMIEVSLARPAEVLESGRALVCPGDRCAEIASRAGRTEFRIRVLEPLETDRYVPSADRLFTSLAQVAGTKAIGVVLTGMGNDGLQGAQAIRDAGGTVIVESEQTAVINGMPGVIDRAGLASKTLGLPGIAEYLGSLCE
jgi:two-component system chemotaxis response regulator CheB